MATRPKSRSNLNDAALIERMQSILVNAAEGRRSIADDRQYSDLRRELRRRPLPLPSLVTTHPTVDSFMASAKNIGDRQERVARILSDFEDTFSPLNLDNSIESSDWTGRQGRAARLKVIRDLIPVAQLTVEAMIGTLAEPGPNGGPLLDEREEAIEHLRQLHGTLGELLAEIDAGRFDDDLGQGLAADAVRLTKRAVHALADDPLPYAISGLLLTIFSSCGMPTVGGFLSDVTFRATGKRELD